MISDQKRHNSRAAQSRRGGFTLVELVTSSAIAAIIMLGITSAMLIAGRALPQSDSPVGRCVVAAEVAERMTAELQYAIRIDEHSDRVIAFAVGDRDGNDIPETIRYEWSGTPGAGLIRQYNTRAPVEVLTDVQELALSYDLAALTTEIATGNESGQTTLAAYNAAQDLHDYPIKDTEWYAQYFLPALPQDALSWRVTRLVIQAKQDAATDGEARVQLQLPTAGNLPSGVVIEEKTFLESTLLSGYMEHEFAFSEDVGFSPEQGVCIVIKWIANGTASKVWGRDKNVTATNVALAKSTDRGASWSPLSAQSLLFSVHGTVTTAGEPQLQTDYRLTGVEIELRAGRDGQSRIQTGVRVLNRPEVSQ